MTFAVGPFPGARGGSVDLVKPIPLEIPTLKRTLPEASRMTKRRDEFVLCSWILSGPLTAFDHSAAFLSSDLRWIFTFNSNTSFQSTSAFSSGAVSSAGTGALSSPLLFPALAADAAAEGAGAGVVEVSTGFPKEKVGVADDVPGAGADAKENGTRPGDDPAALAAGNRGLEGSLVEVADDKGAGAAAAGTGGKRGLLVAAAVIDGDGVGAEDPPKRLVVGAELLVVVVVDDDVFDLEDDASRF